MARRGLRGSALIVIQPGELLRGRGNATDRNDELTHVPPAGPLVNRELRSALPPLTAKPGLNTELMLSAPFLIIPACTRPVFWQAMFRVPANNQTVGRTAAHRAGGASPISPCHKTAIGVRAALRQAITVTAIADLTTKSMKIHRLSFLLGLAAAGVISASAQTTTPAPATAPAPEAAPAPAPAAESSGGSFTFTPAFATQYMFRGSRLDGPSLEPTIEYDNGNFALGVWSNIPLADKVPGQSDPEIDPYGSYKLIVIKDVLSFQPGFTLYTYPNAVRANGFYKLTFEPNVAVNYTVGSLTLSPKVYYDMVLKGATWEFNAAYTVPLKDAGTELDFTGTLGTYLLKDVIPDVSPDVKTWANYYLVGVSMPFSFGKDGSAGKLVIGIAYTKGSDSYFKQGTDPKAINTGAVGRGVATISYAFTF